VGSDNCKLGTCKQKQKGGFPLFSPRKSSSHCPKKTTAGLSRYKGSGRGRKKKNVGKIVSTRGESQKGPSPPPQKVPQSWSIREKRGMLFAHKTNLKEKPKGKRKLCLRQIPRGVKRTGTIPGRFNPKWEIFRSPQGNLGGRETLISLQGGEGGGGSR